MSQLEQERTGDVNLAGRLRPEEDPWSSLAVSQDDVLGDDDGIPSPVVGAHDAATYEEEDVDDADAPEARDVRRERVEHDEYDDDEHEDDARQAPATLSIEPANQAELDD